MADSAQPQQPLEASANSSGAQITVTPAIPPTGASSQQPGAAGAALKRAPPTRQKVPLRPGYHLSDWRRLVATGKDLAGTGGFPQRVTAVEVKFHNKKDDCWVILRGRVYNVTTYLDYHPGGIPKIMAVAGKDATHLFDQYHGWVNYESLLSTSFVGILIPSLDG